MGSQKYYMQLPARMTARTGPVSLQHSVTRTLLCCCLFFLTHCFTILRKVLFYHSRQNNFTISAFSSIFRDFCCFVSLLVSFPSLAAALGSVYDSPKTGRKQQVSMSRSVSVGCHLGFPPMRNLQNLQNLQLLCSKL